MAKIKLYRASIGGPVLHGIYENEQGQTTIYDHDIIAINDAQDDEAKQQIIDDVIIEAKQRIEVSLQPEVMIEEEFDANVEVKE